MATQPTSVLPTREEFLANGLIAVTISADDSLECGICMEEFTEPVTLGDHENKHVFCRACITTYLNGDGDSCPVCRTKLFKKPPPPPRRQHYVERANEILRQRHQSINIETFGVGEFRDTPDTINSLMHSNTNAFLWLRYMHYAPGRVNVNNQIQMTTGMGFINTSRLAVNLAMLVNYIPAVSEARDRTYTPLQAEYWKLVLTTLWSILKHYDGRTTDTSPSALLKRLQKRLRYLPHFNRIPFLVCSGHSLEEYGLYCDLVCLLDYVAFASKKEERKRRRRAPVIEETRTSKAVAVVKRVFYRLTRDL